MIIIACMPAGRAFSWSVQNSLHFATVPTPRGSDLVLTVDGSRALVARVASMPPGATYFFYPVEELLQFLTARGQCRPDEPNSVRIHTPAH